MKFGEVSARDLSRVDEIIARHRDKPGALIPVLHEAQEVVGFLPRKLLERVAEGLDVPISEIYSVVTFYALFSLKPKGRHTISVCKGTACYVRGADSILERLESELGIKAGDTTDDGRFSLQVVRCMGACGLGPVMRIGDDIYARLRPDRIRDILDRYE